MSRAAGLVLAAAGIELANETVFAPITGGAAPWSHLNWRIFPATAILALALSGLEQVAPAFAVGLAGLTVLAVLVIPYGNAASPIENALKTMGYKQ